MLLILAPTLAQAADPTELPPFLRGDVMVGYTYDRFAGGLTEVDYADDPARVGVGERRIDAHRLHYGLQFSVAPGVAIYADLAHDASVMVTYADWHQMVYDPATGSGTYAASGVEEEATLADGGGLAGVWLGVRGTPFSSAFPKRPSPITWLLEGGIRTPSADSNYWVVVEPSSKSLGMRGGGPGSFGLRLATAFSKKVGSGEPYIGAWYQYEAPVVVTLSEDDGTVICKKCEVDPADLFGVRFGTEATLAENQSGARYFFDIHGLFEYGSYGMMPTGLYLPDVIVEDAGTVQTAESLELGGGLGLGLRPFQYLQFKLHGEARYHFPQRIEAPYPVYTSGDSYHLLAGLEMTVRIR